MTDNEIFAILISIFMVVGGLIVMLGMYLEYKATIKKLERSDVSTKENKE